MLKIYKLISSAKLVYCENFCVSDFAFSCKLKSSQIDTLLLRRHTSPPSLSLGRGQAACSRSRISLLQPVTSSLRHESPISSSLLRVTTMQAWRCSGQRWAMTTTRAQVIIDTFLFRINLFFLKKVHVLKTSPSWSFNILLCPMNINTRVTLLYSYMESKSTIQSTKSYNGLYFVDQLNILIPMMFVVVKHGHYNLHTDSPRRKIDRAPNYSIGLYS